LKKDPRRRLRDIGDAYIEITDIAERPKDTSTSPDFSRGRRLRWNLILPWCLAAVCLVLAAIQYFLWSPKGSQAAKHKEPAHLNINLPQNAPLALIGSAPFDMGQRAIALSPDGSFMVYVAEIEKRKTQLYLRRLDSQDALPLPGTTDAYFPFFSPDGQWIGFFQRNDLGVDSLMKISSREGPAHLICEAVQPYGASWSEKDQIVFVNHEGRELLLVSPEGELIKNIPLKADLNIIHGPSFLPGGDHILINDYISAYVVSLGTGEWKFLRYGGSDFHYVHSGHIVFIQDSILFARPFDLSSLRLKGTPFPIIENVRTENLRFGAQYTFSNDGTLVYVPGGSGMESELVWKDPNSGMEETLDFPSDIYGHFRLSPDGRKIVIVIWGRNTKLWIFDLERGGRSLLTDQGDSCIPIWAPDSEHIIYGARQEGSFTYDIYRIKIDGSAEEAILADSKASVYPISLSTDVELLAYMREDPVTLADIWLLPMDDDHRPRSFANTKRMEGLPIFSPDGKYIVYGTDETGQYRLYIRPLDPELGERRSVSTGLAFDPIWPADSRSLYYRSEYQWMRVDVETEPELTLSPPRVIMEGNYLDIPGFSFDVGPDGRLLVLKRTNERTANSLNITQNWFEELKQKMPMGK
jgi:serine/threonine-protein kinase